MSFGSVLVVLVTSDNFRDAGQSVFFMGRVIGIVCITAPYIFRLRAGPDILPGMSFAVGDRLRRSGFRDVIHALVGIVNVDHAGAVRADSNTGGRVLRIIICIVRFAAQLLYFLSVNRILFGANPLVYDEGVGNGLRKRDVVPVGIHDVRVDVQRLLLRIRDLNGEDLPILHGDGKFLFTDKRLQTDQHPVRRRNSGSVNRIDIRRAERGAVLAVQTQGFLERTHGGVSFHLADTDQVRCTERHRFHGPHETVDLVFVLCDLQRFQQIGQRSITSALKAEVIRFAVHFKTEIDRVISYHRVHGEGLRFKGGAGDHGTVCVRSCLFDIEHLGLVFTEMNDTDIIGVFDGKPFCVNDRNAYR